MYSRIRSAVCSGIEGREVFVETDLTRGLPGIGMVGLPSATVMESKDRIRNAIINSGFDYPKGRITINLTPASLRKNSNCLDLPIAAGILASMGSISSESADRWGIIGELTLDGRVLGADGALPMILKMRDAGLDGMIVPEENRDEAALAGGNIYTVKDLSECVDIINDPGRALPVRCEKGEEKERISASLTGPDFGDIIGQEHAKRAVIIAAAGKHGLLMKGNPGCGKTMIACRMPTVMPPMSRREMMETAIIRSAAGKSIHETDDLYARPFRSPHHSIGRAGLIGGGAYPVPGEITMAHNGVLFLDEICEFDRHTIESLRIPMEEKTITHFRKGEAFRFPCNFQVLMAANPCPCGFLGDKKRECRCTQADLERYRRKLSGPIMDRIDMSISMEKVEYEDLAGRNHGMDSASMARKVEAAVSFARAAGRLGFNSELSSRDLEIHCRLGRDESSFMSSAYESLGLSPRSYARTLKVARTIADIEESREIRTVHLAEALSYRMQE